MNGRLIEGALWAVKIALLQSLYLSCANIAEVMSPNTIHLHTDVCMDMGAFPPQNNNGYSPNSFSVILFSNSGETLWMLDMDKTQRSHTLRGAWSAGPREAKTPPTLNLTHISHSVFPFISIPLRIITHILIDWCLHEWLNVFPYVALSTMWHPKRGSIKVVTNHKKKETITPLSGDETDILYSLHLQYHRVFFFTIRPITIETFLLGCSVTQCLSTLSRCDRQGGLMPNTIHQHCSSSNN